MNDDLFGSLGLQGGTLQQRRVQMQAQQAQGEQQYPQACSLGKSSTSLDNDSSDAGSSRVVGQPRFEFGLPQVAPRPESPIGEV